MKSEWLANALYRLASSQIGQATRLTHLFGKRERSGSEIEAHNITTCLCESGSNVTGTSRDIQDARPRMRANGLNESGEAIWIFDKRTRSVCLRLLREFLAHHCFVIEEKVMTSLALLFRRLRAPFVARPPRECSGQCEDQASKEDRSLSERRAPRRRTRCH